MRMIKLQGGPRNGDIIALRHGSILRVPEPPSPFVGRFKSDDLSISTAKIRIGIYEECTVQPNLFLWKGWE